MQAVLAIIMLLLIAGLLWSLWFVLTNPRRRARHIAAALNAPAIINPAPFVVVYHRRSSVIGAVLFAIVAVNIGVRTTAPASIAAIALCILLAAWQAKLATDPKSVLVIHGGGISLVRKRLDLRWEDIETMAIEERGSIFGIERRNLVLELAPRGLGSSWPASRGLVMIDDQTVTILLDLLSPSWDHITRAVHERSGRSPTVAAKYAHAEP